MSEEKIIIFKKMMLENLDNIITTFTLEERIWFKEKILESQMGSTTLFEDIVSNKGEIDCFKSLFTNEESEKMLKNINYNDTYELYKYIPYMICLDKNQKRQYIKEILENQIVESSRTIALGLIKTLPTEDEMLSCIKENIVYLNEMNINIEPDTLIELVNLFETEEKKIELLEEYLKTDENKLEFCLFPITNSYLTLKLNCSNELITRIIRQIQISKIPQNLKTEMLIKYCTNFSENQIEEIIREINIESRIEICKKICSDNNYYKAKQVIENILSSIPIEDLSTIKKIEILTECLRLPFDLSFVEKLNMTLPSNEQIGEISKYIQVKELKIEEKLNILLMTYNNRNIITFDDDFINQVIKSLPIKDEMIKKILSTFNNPYMHFVPVEIIITELIKTDSLSAEEKYQILVLDSNSDGINKLFKKEQRIEIIKSLPVKEKLKILGVIALEIEEKKEILKTLTKEEIEINFKDFAVATTNLEELVEILTNMNLYSDSEFLEKIKDDYLDYVSKDKFINRKRLNEFYQMFGTELLGFINNEKIRGILKLPDEYYNKIIKLYNSSVLNNSIINTVYNSLIQREFGRTNEDVINIGANLKTYLENKDLDNVKKLVKIISEDLNVNNLLKSDVFIKYISDKNYEREYCYKNIESILMEICTEQMRTYNSFNFELLNIITNNYITTKREKYLNERQKSFNKDLKFPTTIDKDKLIQKVIKDLSEEELINLINKIDLKVLSEEQKDLITNKDLLIECIKFKKNPAEYKENELVVDKKILTSKYLKIFNQVTEILFNNKILDKYATQTELIKYIPKQFGKKGLEILAGINYNKFSRNVLSTDKYEELKTVMEKYGFLAWNDIFEVLVNSSRTEIDIDIIASLLEYFSVISEKVDKTKKSGMMDEYLNKASAYSPFSKLCKILFEEENLMFLKHNNPPNSAHTIVGKDRIVKAEEYIPLMYKRENITVPPINEVFMNDKEDKSLNVVIGDVTNMINFTYGERTESCMRIGGVANSLFEYALINENGFHIRFEDPKTGKFVSRASCFRNGNTLFINQLRDSCQEEYTNNDLCEICTKVANKLIELTSNSRYPINNVIISGEYAMEKSNHQCIKLNVTAADIKEEYGGYTDISPDSAIVLATTAKDKPYADFDLGKEKTETYPVLRSSPITHTNKSEAASRINQLRLINQLLINDSLGGINLLTEDKIQIAITGEDWFVYVDDKDDIVSKILDNLPEEKRKKASEEVKAALNMLEITLKENQGIQIEDEEKKQVVEGGKHARR